MENELKNEQKVNDKSVIKDLNIDGYTYNFKDKYQKGYFYSAKIKYHVN